VCPRSMRLQRRLQPAHGVGCLMRLVSKPSGDGAPPVLGSVGSSWRRRWSTAASVDTVAVHGVQGPSCVF
jgi:hypothetical protein